MIRLIKEGEAKPSLVIGLPVGFVSAAESKEELAKLDVPFITNVGRKGGSTVTVAALNAFLFLQIRNNKMEEKAKKKDQKEMRAGYTTGACATATTKAALTH